VSLFGLTPRQAIGRGLVSAVMQTGGLLSDVTVRDTMKLTASLFTHTTSIDAALERAGIADIAEGAEVLRRPAAAALRFAMALVSDPGLIVLDEPTTGMDVEGRHSFWQAIHADAQRGRTVLFATHYLEEADQYADRIVLIRKGRIVADGTTAEIKAMASGRTIEAEWDEAAGSGPGRDRGAGRRRSRRGARPPHHPGERFRCGRPPPADAHVGARHHDHQPEPGAGVPAAHGRRHGRNT
jgi:ABC-2 type transport system ATP-binding protein